MKPEELREYDDGTLPDESILNDAEGRGAKESEAEIRFDLRNYKGPCNDKELEVKIKEVRDLASDEGEKNSHAMKNRIAREIEAIKKDYYRYLDEKAKIEKLIEEAK